MISWELSYPDGSTWQPLPGVAESIAEAKPGALFLTILRDTARLGTVELTPPKEKPVFYRWSYIDGLGAGAGETAKPLAIVFGRATPDGEECDLWTMRDGEFVACPRDLFDPLYVRVCLGLA